MCRFFPSSKNEEHLADYLSHLTTHREEYLEYFWWKPFYHVVDTPVSQTRDGLPPLFACRLCEFLHKEKGREEKVYRDLRGWWEGGAGCSKKTTNQFCNRIEVEYWWRGREKYRDFMANWGKDRLVELQTFVDQ